MLRRLACGALLVVGIAGSHADAALILTAEAAGVQTTSVAGVTTVPFTLIGVGTYTSLTTGIGSFGGPGLAIVDADVFGGAGGTGHYFAVGVQSNTLATTLTLNGPQAFFGFWWSAADPDNGVEFYSGAALIGTFNPTTALGALGAAYFGNPNPTQSGNTGEKYAYLNFIGTGGTTFNKIVFKNASTTFSGFEADNFSVRATPVTDPPPGTLIGGGVSQVPEPWSAVVWACSAALGGLACRRRGRT